MKKILLLLFFFAGNADIHAQRVLEPDTKSHPEWSKPIAPFKVAGNLYYVGTADLACYLIVTTEGNILINTGLAASAALIKSNIQALGFSLADTKILLTTQAHYDHVGAMAEIKKITGAKMMVDYADAQVIADGGISDYDLKGDVCVFEPIKVDRVLRAGDSINLGNTSLVMLHHPGHTKGSCSYIFNLWENGRKYRVLIANLPTIPTDKKFSQLNAYPNIARDYACTLKAMRKIKFDIWVASHGVQFSLLEKVRSGTSYPKAFIDKKNYYRSIKELQKDYKQKLNEN